MKSVMISLSFLAVVGAVPAAAQSSAVAPPATGPWARITQQDLDEIHRLLVANHPGQVDSLSSVFRQWNQTGYAEASARARQASSFYDYKRAIQFFINGFQDDHAEVRLDVDAINKVWPGFLAAAEVPDQVHVVYSERDDAPVGARIVSCDGVDAGTLLRDRVLTYYWNSRLPRELPYISTRIMVLDGGDTPARFKSCVLEVGDQSKDIDLSWRILASTQALDLQKKAMGWVHPEMDVVNRDGVWFVSPNTLQINTPKDVADFRAFLAKVDAHRDELRRGPLVLDLRGVPGGVSSWGDETVAHIYGKAWVDYLQAEAAATDWRVSPDNMARHAGLVARLEASGLGEDAKFYAGLAQKMGVALAKGEPFVRTGEAPKKVAKPAANPVTGSVYLITDGICKSACLDFVDLARKLPDICPIGRPTGADTLYMENTFRDLPSGFGRLTYSQKVNRQRPRGANAWYEPSSLWTGGAMTTEAMARWVKALDQQRKTDPKICQPRPAITAP